MGGPWLVSAFIGTLCGLAALAMFAARARAGKLVLVMIGPVILMVIGLLISQQEFRLTAVHAGLVTTAFQTGTLAFTGVMTTGLVAGLCLVYVRLLSPTGAENRKAARIPSTSLHISRTEDWEAAPDHPIGPAGQVPAAVPALLRRPRPADLRPGAPDGTRLLLQWRQGQVTVVRVSLDVAADAALIAPLAREFDAHVYAEDGTRYA